MSLKVRKKLWKIQDEIFSNLTVVHSFNLMKITVLFLLLLFSVSGAAQEKCVLENTPALFNLKLGMSPQEVQSILGQGVKIKIKQSGQRTFFENFIDKPALNTLTGVRAIYLRFLDGRLYQIEIFYEERNSWQTLENFLADFSAKNGLPVSDWQIKYDVAEIKCSELSIIADRVLNPRIQLTDEIARAKVKEIREEN